jgi:hypothetical protein
VNKEDVQAIHYFANTSQLFLSDLMARDGRLRPRDQVMLTIEYEHPETGQEMVEEYAFALGAIENADRNVPKGRLVMRFIDGLAELGARPRQYGTAPGSWEDSDAYALCDAGRQDLTRLADPLAEDLEARRVVALWDRYCSRYERSREPVRRPRPAQTGWPSAQGR